MDKQTRINDFVMSLEGLSSSISGIAFEISSPFIDSLGNLILEYINEKYPAIIITKEELKTEIEKVYRNKHSKLKTNIDINIGSMKYKLEEPTINVDEIIKEEIEKYKTMFMSVQAGTNISYLGLVEECTQNVMALLIRKNTSISFAKRTEEVREYISKLVSDCYLSVMIALSDKLLDDGIIPIEEDFQIDNGKSKIKTEEF